VTLAPGSTFGPYKILEPLGRGGMASVFKAYEPSLDRYVALKVLPASSVQDEASAERFRREAKVIARLEHPNITPIHNFGIDEPTQVPWMAMRLISGGTLSSRLTMRMTPQRAVAILRGVADALDYAHGKGVMHRDVKPANILLDEAGRVYLADFGIARLVEGATALTAAGLISGTPAYMAPEQATGVALDHRVDIYALGVVAYEILAGHPPFAADNPIDVLMKQVQAPVPVVPDLPPSVMGALLKALSKKADDRFQSAGALVTALEDAIGDMPVVSARPTDPAMAALPITAAGPLITSATATTPVKDPDVPTVVAATRRSAVPTVVAAPTRAWGAGVLAMIIGGVALVGLVALFGLYSYLGRPDGPPVTTGSVPAAAAPGAPVSTAPLGAPVTAPPVTEPPRAEAVERETAETPATLPPPRATLPAATTTLPAVRPPSTTAPAPPVSTAVGTLRLDVSAAQPSFGAMAASVTLEVRVDGETIRTLTLTFDGTTPFARSRRRQTFDVEGVRAGDRDVTVIARSEGGLSPVRAQARVDVPSGGTATTRLDVRLRGNGEGDAAFR
jgi:hypothetical protein